jgi:sec-independent protein translocase protein TatA
MPNLGMSELLVVFMIIVLVFGASRLPAIGEGLGRTVRNLKRSLSNEEKIGVSDRKAVSEGEKPAGRSSDQEVSDADIVDKSS